MCGNAYYEMFKWVKKKTSNEVFFCILLSDSVN